MHKYFPVFVFLFSIAAFAQDDSLSCDRRFTTLTEWNPEASADNAGFSPVSFTDTVPEYFSFSIYDRWGREVFKTDRYYQCWNGRMQNKGNFMPDGTYYWFSSCKMKSDPDTITCNGHLTCYDLFMSGSIRIYDTLGCDSMIYIANTFTAGDDGINDTWGPLFYCAPYDFHLWLFDRWGNIIWENTDYRSQWDGSLKNKSPAQTEVYVYKLKYRITPDSPLRSHAGTVTLIR